MDKILIIILVALIAAVVSSIILKKRKLFNAYAKIGIIAAILTLLLGVYSMSIYASDEYYDAVYNYTYYRTLSREYRESKNELPEFMSGTLEYMAEEADETADLYEEDYEKYTELLFTLKVFSVVSVLLEIFLFVFVGTFKKKRVSLENANENIVLPGNYMERDAVPVEMLLKYKEMLDNGLITQEDFQKLKQKIL